MRIVTWNCSRGPFAAKLQAVQEMGADVAILSESAKPSEETDSTAWFSAGKYGTVVWVRTPYALQDLPQAKLPCCVNPLRVIGPVSFNLLAVWTWPAPSYKAAFSNGLTAYQDLLNDGPSVVAGDFNGNVSFDKPRSRNKWRSLFERLESHGLRSAYHAATSENIGQETAATHYHKRKPGSRFHIDYCFIPQHWCNASLRVGVSEYDNIPLQSDHVPIVVDVSLVAKPALGIANAHAATLARS